MYSSISEVASPFVANEILSLANRRRISIASKSPSFLRGWHFLSILPSDDIESLCIKAVPSAEGPSITFNANFIDAEYLEDPAAALVWLPLALNHLCTEMLHEDGDDGLFQNENWQDFRLIACDNMSMSWDQILTSADRLGTTYMAESLASALFVESGLMDILIARRDSKAKLLKSA
ncbi:hypothetical protein G6L37_04470 [Agrobacterium rubi]|nr:hypothetical protein [Agrobacterium rubi]NTF24607.1 hypothetical protein [Agrobacterium rubi]